jgi:hypothetical protein
LSKSAFPASTSAAVALLAVLDPGQQHDERLRLDRRS